MSRSRKLVNATAASASSLGQGVESLAGASRAGYQERGEQHDLGSMFYRQQQQQQQPSSHQQSPPFFRDDRPKSPVSTSPSTSQNNNQFSSECCHLITQLIAK